LTKDITALAALFATSGVTHFIKPQHFEGIVPKLLPRKRELVYISGVAELACAAGLLHPRTRKAAGLASAALPRCGLPGQCADERRPGQARPTGGGQCLERRLRCPRWPGCPCSFR
jgi:uncharacterized membrane protein